jgi:hypothetical protein
MPDNLPGVKQACLYILLLKPGIPLQDRFRGVTGSEHRENMFNGQSASSDDRLATEDVGIHGYPPKDVLIVHGILLSKLLAKK